MGKLCGVWHASDRCGMLTLERRIVFSQCWDDDVQVNTDILGCSDAAAVTFLVFLCPLISIMDPGGRRHPLKGHEKSTGWLSQHTALACGFLKAQTTKCLHSSFSFFSFCSVICVPPLHPSWHGEKGCSWVLVFYTLEWLVPGEMTAAQDKNLPRTAKHSVEYCFVFINGVILS